MKDILITQVDTTTNAAPKKNKYLCEERDEDLAEYIEYTSDKRIIINNK